jgi:hypothetical protein
MEREDNIMEKVDKHQEKLIRSISEEVTSLFEKVLDYAEVAVPNSDQYRKLRSKILRIGNNSIRNISKEIVGRYSVTYNPPGETIIEVKRGKVTAKEEVK